MTARIAGGAVSVAAVVLAASCTHFYEIPIETPIKSQLDVTPFQRVLVAGFIAGGSQDIDANVETTRLLRSQLRTKSALRVIDADTLPLMEVAMKRDGEPGSDSSAAAPPAIKEEKDLEPYKPLFANAAYWKGIGDEYQQPLIVTGTVMFTPQERTQQLIRNEEQYDSFGRRTTAPVRVYQDRKGFLLKPTFVFIDGRTGAPIHTETFSEEILYSANQQTPALSSYFELMDRLIPSVLGALSSQKIKGTRFLLQ
jgi:hypothetical protein